MLGVLEKGWREVSSRRASLVCMLSFVASACAAAGLNNGVYRDDDLAFRVGPIPEHWRSVEADTNDPELVSFAFHSDRSQITVGIAARCGRDGDDVPLRALTQHLYLGFTERTTRLEREFTLDGRAALRTEMVASLDGVPQDLTFVVLKKDGCVYDFWRVGAKPPQDTEFDEFVHGFQVLAR